MNKQSYWEAKAVYHEARAAHQELSATRTMEVVNAEYKRVLAQRHRELAVEARRRAGVQ